MAKEYQFSDYKALDTGYQIKLYKKTLDEFGTFYYKSLSNYRYKEDPAEDKSNMPPFYHHGSEEYALVLKTLLELNENLKFYNKMDEALK